MVRKLKLSILKIICFGVLITLFASCNTGNKFASSFGKRRYTKGYYFNRIARKSVKIQPVIAANKNRERGINPVATIKNVIDNKAVYLFSSVSLISSQSQRKAQPLGVNNNLKAVVQNVPIPIESGVPGHGNTTEVNSNKHDGEAQAGLGLSILSIILAIVGGIGFILVIPALIFSIIGLGSKRYQALAIIGLVLSILLILVGILLIAEFAIFLGTLSLI